MAEGKEQKEVELISCHMVLSSSRDEPYFRVVGKLDGKEYAVEVSFEESKTSGITGPAASKIKQCANDEAHKDNRNKT